MAAVADAAGRARAAWLTLVLVTAYLGITAAATTDRDLFLSAGVSLPVLNVSLPIVSFYFWAPYLLVVLHAFALLQLKLLSERFHAFNASLHYTFKHRVERSRQLRRLDPFLLLQMLAGRGGILTATVMWTTVVFAPIAVILLMQVRFLPVHNELTTWSHRAALLLDLGIVAVMWVAILHPSGGFVSALTGSANDIWRRLQERGREVEAAPNLPIAGKLIIAAYTETSNAFAVTGRLILFATILIFFSFVVATIPDGRLERRIVALVQHMTGFDQTAPEGTGNSLLVIRKGRPILRLTHLLLEETRDDGKPYLFSRNLALAGEKLFFIGDKLASREPTLEELERLRPSTIKRGANLRYADLSDTDLRNVDLGKADLYGAKLDRAKLPKSFFDCDGNETMRDSIPPDRVCPTTVYASFRGVDFSRLRKNGRPVSKEKSHERLGERLLSDHYRDQVRRRSTITASDAIAALINGCPILQFRDFTNTDFSDTDFVGAIIRMVDFTRSRFDGAEMSGVTINRSSLRLVSMNSATLSDTSVAGSDLSGIKIQNGVLRRLHIRSSNLMSSALEWRHMSDIKIEDSTLSHSLLGSRSSFGSVRHMTLQGVDLSFSVFRYKGRETLFRASQLRGVDITGAKAKPIDDRGNPLFSRRRIRNICSELTEDHGSDPAGDTTEMAWLIRDRFDPKKELGQLVVFDGEQDAFEAIQGEVSNERSGSEYRPLIQILDPTCDKEDDISSITNIAKRAASRACFVGRDRSFAKPRFAAFLLQNRHDFVNCGPLARAFVTRYMRTRCAKTEDKRPKKGYLAKLLGQYDECVAEKAEDMLASYPTPMNHPQ